MNIACSFRPHPLVRGGHLQTIVGAYLPHPARLQGTVNHQIPLPDGDRLILHDDAPPSWTQGNRVVLLVHGLGGCHESPYCLRLAQKLHQHGIRSFRLDLRGCGAGYALARHPGHAGRSEDARAAIEMIASLCPGSPVSAIGYSMGGNIVLKLAGECGAQPPGGLDRVAAVCPPIDLSYCSQNMTRGLNWIYDQTFIRSLTQLVERRRRELPELAADLGPLVPPPRRLFEFDDRFTAPRSGYSGAAEYYARCSSAPLLHCIDLPTLIITAADDPLIPVEMFERAERSTAVALHIAESGGHLGFVARRGVDPDRRWLDWRLLEWVLRS